MTPTSHTDDAASINRHAASSSMCSRRSPRATVRADDVFRLDADGDLNRARIKRYAYPESRLEPREENDQ